MRRGDPRTLLAWAWVLAGIATLASINFTGIPPLGWKGMGLVACDLCWYQRILMYPLVMILGLAWWKKESTTVLAALVLAGLGAAVATYHSLVEKNPDLELGACSVVTCSVSPWMLGPLTIPNLSMIAFLGVTGLLAAYRKAVTQVLETNDLGQVAP